MLSPLFGSSLARELIRIECDKIPVRAFLLLTFFPPKKIYSCRSGLPPPSWSSCLRRRKPSPPPPSAGGDDDVFDDAVVAPLGAGGGGEDADAAHLRLPRPAIVFDLLLLLLRELTSKGNISLHHHHHHLSLSQTLPPFMDAQIMEMGSPPPPLYQH